MNTGSPSPFEARADARVGARTSIAAMLIALASATALAQSSPSYFDRHCAQQPTDPRARTELTRRLVAQLESGTSDERSLAADTLSCFGESSRAAVPAMIRLFADPGGEIQANAVAAVANLGGIAVPALVTALDSSDLSTRNNAARALARIGPPAQAALPRLRQLAADANPEYSPSAERAIRRIGSAARK